MLWSTIGVEDVRDGDVEDFFLSFFVFLRGSQHTWEKSVGVIYAIVAYFFQWLPWKLPWICPFLEGVCSRNGIFKDRNVLSGEMDNCYSCLSLPAGEDGRWMRSWIRKTQKQAGHTAESLCLAGWLGGWWNGDGWRYNNQYVIFHHFDSFPVSIKFPLKPQECSIKCFWNCA